MNFGHAQSHEQGARHLPGRTRSVAAWPPAPAAGRRPAKAPPLHQVTDIALDTVPAEMCLKDGVESEQQVAGGGKRDLGTHVIRHLSPKRINVADAVVPVLELEVVHHLPPQVIRQLLLLHSRLQVAWLSSMRAS